MGRFLVIAIALFCIGCTDTKIDKDQLPMLNGYWEIKEVTFPDGNKKEYGMNPTIDFIHLEDQKGYRKKMKPKFDGNYQTTNAVENFVLVQNTEHFLFSYENSLNRWEETLETLDSLSFSVRNEEGVLYTYSRFTPISIPK